MLKKVVNTNEGEKRFTDLVGVDFSTTATKIVRLKESKGEISLAGIDLMPPVDFGTSASRFELPRNLTAYYGCLSYTGKAAVVRMINTPLSGADEELPDSRLRELLNVTDDFRVSSHLVKKGQGRQDSSLLAAAIPMDDVRYLLNMFPSGPPAPASIELSGLSFVSAFLHARGAECANESVCLLEAGETLSHFVFLNHGQIALVGKMPIGASVIRQKIATDLGVDEELATSILKDTSINISSSLISVLAPFIKQISISKDFIERHQGCRVSKVYVSGGLSMLSSWADELGPLLNSDLITWSPLENITCDSEILTAEMKAQVTRFSAAVGAAIGGFEVS